MRLNIVKMQEFNKSIKNNRRYQKKKKKKH